MPANQDVKKRRLFVAINFPEEIKGEIYLWQRQWWDLPVRWTPKENIHLTLFFLGWVLENGVPELCEALKRVAEKHEPFTLRLEDISYGPKDGPKRMIWLNGEVPENLGALVDDLKRAILQVSFARELHEEERAFRAHITLARFKEGDWRRKIGRMLPQIETPFVRDIRVVSIDLMESKLQRQGSQYRILLTCPLGIE